MSVDPSDPVLLNNSAMCTALWAPMRRTSVASELHHASSPLATAYINLANHYLYRLNQNALGVTTIQAAMRNMPTDTDLGVLLEIAYDQVHDGKDALAAYQAVLKLDPTNVAAKAGLQRLVPS